MADPAAHKRADESVAARFTRLMNATTSRYGLLSDPPIVAVSTAPFLIALLAALELGAPPPVAWALGALTALPTLIAIVVSIALRGARSRVVGWLAELPFPVENVNALLNGLGESIEVTFAGDCPKTPELNAALDQVSPDAFVTRAPDVADAAPGDAAAPKPVASNEPIVEIRIGVVESKRNPAASNHARFMRVRALVSSVLLPLHERFKVVEVRVK